MKRQLYIVTAFVILVSAMAQANAANCARAAKQLAASRGAQVLAATPVSSGGQTICQIKLLIPGKNGKPPRVETMRVNG